MAEVSVQTPSECVPSQLSGASSELPLSGCDATLPLSQSPHTVLASIANDALPLPLPLLSCLSPCCACLLYPSPISYSLMLFFLFFFTTALKKREDFQRMYEEVY